jgi:hypothetical protein
VSSFCFGYGVPFKVLFVCVVCVMTMIFVGVDVVAHDKLMSLCKLKL